MADVNMPRLSDTMQEGTITRWLKKPGDEVKRGEVVAEVETDKANMEIEAYDSGVLQQILVQEGETAPIGQVIAVISSKKDAAHASTPSAQPAPKATQMTQVSTSSSAGSNSNGSTHVAGNQRALSAEREVGFVKASPLARRIAEEHGIDLSQLKGTGPGGRIVRDDVEDVITQRTAVPVASLQASASSQVASPIAAQPPVTASLPAGRPEAVTVDADVVNLTSMQKTIARRLTESKQTVPHFYIGNEIDMTDALVLRKKLNDSFAEEGTKISVNDLIVKACAQALEKFPEVNGSYKDGQFLLHKHVNVGIAVDIAAGLIVPVIRDANLKGLRAIARETRDLAAKAQAGKLTPAELDGGTFSISNLGMMDVTDFVAVINPPQSAILAVAATRKTFVPINDQPVIRDIMHVTLSADHRILYGATVARFLKEVKRLLQNPFLLLG
jgi:pyruvate dehydrogenase E2 component (dihydrolipoamide acetyltransferase)